MESHDVLKECIHEFGVKRVASEMKLSTSLIYKWCQKKEGDSGADNPLDRIENLVRVTKDDAPVHWLCQRFDGFYVSNPVSLDGASREPALLATQRLLQEFSDILAEVSSSLADDNAIDQEEAGRIRKEWEELKVLAESFVVACEAGSFGPAAGEP